MSTLNEQFEQAVADSKNLAERPDNMTLLKLYALYKQGSVPATPTASVRASPTWWARAKWDAWNETQGPERPTRPSRPTST